MNKGQSAMELVILVGTVLFFVTAFLLGVQYTLGDRITENKNTVLRDVASQVQDEINLAVESTDGYRRTFTLPQKILGTAYEIDISGETVFARTTDGRYTITLPVAQVTGNVDVGENTIEKTNGVIILNGG